ncbi:MAG: DUF6883 domain-containing protein [Pseudolabrys sp.]|jgi:hypothetical protein
MSPLPQAERAILAPAKLAGYCLSLSHPRGRHKARVFREALGVGTGDAEWLRQALLAGLSTTDAVELESDAFGTRWLVDVPLRRQDRQAVVRTVWIVRNGEQAPRFVTCWVL